MMNEVNQVKEEVGHEKSAASVKYKRAKLTAPAPDIYSVGEMKSSPFFFCLGTLMLSDNCKELRTRRSAREVRVKL